MADQRRQATMQINFSDFHTTLSTFCSIQKIGSIPNDFMATLRILLKLNAVNDELKQFLTIFYWDEDSKTFKRDWDMETIDRAICVMEMWKDGIDIETIASLPTTTTEELDDARRQHGRAPKPSPISPRSQESPCISRGPARRSLQRVCDEMESFSTTDTSSSLRSQFEYLSLEGKGNDASLTSLRRTLPEWRRLVGREVKMLQSSEFTKVGKILLPKSQAKEEAFTKAVATFEGDDQGEWIGKLLPFMIQKIKMWGCGILEPKAIKELLRTRDDSFKPPTDRSRRPRFLRNNPVAGNEDSSIASPCNAKAVDFLPASRIDLLTCIINSVDVVVAQDLLRNLASFPVALPLIVPSIFEKKMTNLTPLLKYISLRRRCSNDDVEENFFFTAPYKLVLAVRLGRTEDVGKSCILNCLLKRKYTFSSKQEPGADLGKPLSLPGFVEFVPLTEETCSAELWQDVLNWRETEGCEELILLANMHGDPADHRDVFRTMLNLASGVVVFTMSEIDQEKSEDVWQELVDVFGEEIPYLEVTADSSIKNVKDVVSTADLNNDVVLQRVRNAVLAALDSEKSKSDLDFGNFSTVTLAEDVMCEESKMLTEIIHQDSVKTLRCVMVNPLNAVNTLQKNKLEEVVLERFYSILKLQPISKRIRAFIHLEKELFDATNKHATAIRNKLVRFKTELTKTDDEEANHFTRESLQRQITEQMNLLDEYNLGLEHFYRKVGRVYEDALLKPEDPKTAQLLDLPSYYADLLLQGNAIELLDGECTRPTINATWFTAISNKICEARPGLRIFVVSVIGPQSSGKSTLLNALFGCKFAVSVGRCTRGLFLRLLFLEDELKEQLNADAIIIIDMEGLDSPEKKNDTGAEEKDVIMTTFVMGISNLILININGESANSMADILQVAIVAMARIDVRQLPPDLFVVQYLPEKNPQRIERAHNEFIKAIEKAIHLTEGKGVYIGIQDSTCMKNLMQRAKRGNVLKAFGPFRNGEHVNSPPSAGYHESIADLYTSILEACKECDSKVTLDFWSKLINGYLHAVIFEGLVVRFKNLFEMCEHLDRGKMITEAKEAIETAFREHVSDTEPEIRRKIQNIQEKHPGKENSELSERLEHELMEKITNKLRRIPHNCSNEQQESMCRSCADAVNTTNSLFRHVKGTAAEKDTVSTVTKFIDTTRNGCIERLESMIGAELLQQGLFKDFHEIINKSLSKYTEEKGTRKDEDCSEIADSVWNELFDVVSKKYPHIKLQDRIAKDIVAAYENCPQASSRYLSPIRPDLQFNAAYRSKSFFDYKVKLKPLKSHNYFELVTYLDKLPETFVEKYNIQNFNEGLMFRVRSEIEAAIDQFQDKTGVILLGDFKLDAHVYTLQIFGRILHSLQRKWESAHHPMKMLEQNRDMYMDMIHTRIRYGFTTAGEGLVIANLLIQAIVKKARNQGSNSRFNRILDLPWIVNSENVRLRFFSLLAQQVESGDNKQALEYFTSPEMVITSWFKKEVDSLYEDQWTKEFQATYKSEVDHVSQDVRNKITMTELKLYLEEYLTQVESVTYQSSLENIEGNGFDFLKRNVEDGLRNEKKWRWAEKTRPIAPSESDRIMARLGCTEHCFWCGALCWGQRGHNTNQDSTKNHHACHQPRGLIGIDYKVDRTLTEKPCHEVTDKWTVFWGEHKEKGMLWKDAKQHEKFKNWLYDQHTKVEFNQLMYWFFKKLNQPLADKLRKLPAPATKLTGGSYDALNSSTLDQILAAISQQIRSSK